MLAIFCVVGMEPGKHLLPMMLVCAFVSWLGPVVVWKLLNSFIMSALFCAMPLGKLLTDLCVVFFQFSCSLTNTSSFRMKVILFISFSNVNKLSESNLTSCLQLV